MGTNGTLPRRLSTAGCKTAGTQLKAEVEGLKAEGVALSKEEIAAARDVGAATEAVSGFEKGGDMPSVDRAVDSATAAFDDALEGMANGLAGADILPLTEEERAAGELATKVRAELFPGGTAFVQLPYRQQWAKLETLGRKLDSRRADLKKLGLDVQAARLSRWIALYGERLGVTRASTPSDAEARAVDQWHRAWQRFVDVVRYHRTDDDAAVRERLLSPYERQAEDERAADRGKRKPKAAPVPA